MIGSWFGLRNSLLREIKTIVLISLIRYDNESEKLVLISNETNFLQLILRLEVQDKLEERSLLYLKINLDFKSYSTLVEHAGQICDKSRSITLMKWVLLLFLNSS